MTSSPKVGGFIAALKYGCGSLRKLPVDFVQKG